MSSPFPGMDPFLERADVFPDLHDGLIIYLREALQSRLPAPYFAGTGRRVWVEFSHRPIQPDVNVRRGHEEPHSGDEAGGTATAIAVRAQPIVITVPHDERREPFVEIIRADDEGERLVTVIEVLSPANKTPGEQGRDLYLRKQREVLGSKIHLVEIDLLRGGEHTTAIPYEYLVREAAPFDYYVCIHRFDNLEDYFVYPILLSQALPEIAIPLMPGDGEVTIDLQAVFKRCYETGPYRRRIRYERESPEPPLTREQLAWAKERIGTRT